jgi:predicted nucleic acid-binding protein
MLTYLDSSVLGRAYLADEPGHDAAVALLDDPDAVLVTSTLTRIEVTGLLVRAARAGRCDAAVLLTALRVDLDTDGPVTTLVPRQPEVERVALDITAAHGIRALDALHVAVAHLAARALAGDAPVGFATRDAEQAEVAQAYGFVCR